MRSNRLVAWSLRPSFSALGIDPHWLCDLREDKDPLVIQFTRLSEWFSSSNLGPKAWKLLGDLVLSQWWSLDAGSYINYGNSRSSSHRINQFSCEEQGWAGKREGNNLPFIMVSSFKPGLLLKVLPTLGWSFCINKANRIIL